jgi:hypothetical protein
MYLALPYEMRYTPRMAVKPKSKCCNDRPRCNRCPIRLLKEGKLPSGYTVKHRELVKVDKRKHG